MAESLNAQKNAAVIIRGGASGKSGRPLTYGELFRRADENRKAMPERLPDRKEREIGRIRNEAEAVRRELEFLEAAPLIPEK